MSAALADAGLPAQRLTIEVTETAALNGREVLATLHELRGLGVPAMLVYGDADIVRPEHMAETFRLLGGGVPGDMAGLPRARLAVLPGTTHVTLVQRGDWLASMVGEFLDAETG